MGDRTSGMIETGSLGTRVNKTYPSSLSAERYGFKGVGGVNGGFTGSISIPDADLRTTGCLITCVNRAIKSEEDAAIDWIHHYAK